MPPLSSTHTMILTPRFLIFVVVSCALAYLIWLPVIYMLSFTSYLFSHSPTKNTCSIPVATKFGPFCKDRVSLLESLSLSPSDQTSIGNGTSPFSNYHEQEIFGY